MRQERQRLSMSAPMIHVIKKNAMNCLNRMMSDSKASPLEDTIKIKSVDGF